MTVLQLDHQRYIDDQAYRREVHIGLRRLVGKGSRTLGEMNIVHEAGNACCVREPWPITHARLVAALAADGDRMLGVVL